MKQGIFAWVLLFVAAVGVNAGSMPEGDEYTNSIGMKLVRIEPGTFEMGQIKLPLPFEILPHNSGRGDRIDVLREGDYDERPVHTVKITKSFYLGVFEVTNLQYELFDPNHKLLRGKDGYSKQDNEAVIDVNWYEARAFCEWLSQKEGLPYRLPTEAEWEYACRAGTTTNYYPGDILPEEYLKNNRWDIRKPDPNGIPLTVGETPANRLGLHDMHGNVEEWCADWYGPYIDRRQTDPTGYVDGEFRVTRGGSHDTPLYALRSANRQGALPETKNWNIGFRVMLGKRPATKPLPIPPPPLHQRNVIERDHALVSQGPPADQPYFSGPRRFVNIPKEQAGPVFAAHNHGPAIAACPNGDLLTVWFSCASERNREMTQGGSRLRWGADQWDQASLFFDAPDRNDPTPTMWTNEKGTIFYFIGTSAGGEYKSLALAMRKSNDSGATWSKARLVMHDFNDGKQGSEPIFRMNDGSMALVVDGRRALWFSRDEGLTWSNPGGGLPGIHAGIAQVADGRLIGFCRGGEIDGRMPKGVSTDFGKTFTITASEFPGVDGGQRLVLLRLREGPLLFAGFAAKGITITDASGKKREVRGLYTAVSADSGESWPHKRLVTDDGPGRPVETMSGSLFLMSERHGEYQGYISICQGVNGLIHLITSKQHYTFNLKWAMTPAPPLRHPPLAVKPVKETFAGPKRFDADGWVPRGSYKDDFNGKGQYRVESMGRMNGINRILGKGSFEAGFTVRNFEINPGDGGHSPGPRIYFKDARTRSLSLRFDKDRIALDIKDEEATKGRLKRDSEDVVRYDKPPGVAKARLTWNEEKLQWRIFYGLNGAEPTTELPESKKGIYFGKPFSDTTAVYLAVDHGSAEFDDFFIKPL